MAWDGWSRGDERSWGLYGPYRADKAVVVTWTGARLWASSREEWGWARSVVVVLGLEVGWWMSVVVFSGRPSSTSAHSAGVEREGGRCSWPCSFCVIVCPVALTADPDGKSGQASCKLRAQLAVVNWKSLMVYVVIRQKYILQRAGSSAFDEPGPVGSLHNTKHY